MSDQLTRAARTRHNTVTAKADAALRELSVQRLPVTGTAVTRRAGMSTDFPYRHPILRAKITSMRLSTRPDVGPDQEPESDDGSTSAAVRAFSARLKKLTTRHRADIAALEPRPRHRAW